MSSFALLLALIALEPYLPLVPRTYVYRSPSGEEITVEVLAVEVEGAPGAARISSDRRRTVETFDPEAGFLVYRSSRSRSGELTYERPLAILPASMETGVLHRSQRRFVRKLSGSISDVGAHYAEAELLGVEEISTPNGTFSDCLRVRRHETRMDFSGGQEVYDATEWYARGVGLVKAQGERVEKDANGEIQTREVVDLTLVSSGEPE